jgi:hypothetical protein
MLAEFMERRILDPVEIRTRFRQAAAEAMVRMSGFSGFTPAAQAELRGYRPIFLVQMRTAWKLAAGER